MTTDEKIIAEMLDRATDPLKDEQNSDRLSLKMFCMVVSSNNHNVHFLQQALEMIVKKIRSTNETEALKAISMLEECMSSCGTEFQDEVSKFRFLNMLISLVSVKYVGRETPKPIKQRIMDLLLLWTAEFPQRTKIREAYDSLKKEISVEQHVASHVTTNLAAPKRENIFATDEEALSKLVRSTNQEDLMRANLLIQHRVKQEALRTELLVQHKSELQEARNTVNLLDQMLSAFKNDPAHLADDLSLIEELYIACKAHKPIVERLPELIEKDEDFSDFVLKSDALDTKNMLQQVMQRYKDIVHQNAKGTKQNRKITNVISDLLGDVVMDKGSTVLEPPADDVVGAAVSSSTFAMGANAITLEELSKIFNSSADLDTDDGAAALQTKSADAVFDNLELLEPVNVFASALKETSRTNGFDTESAEKRSPRELRDIDQLSQDLLAQNLKSTERMSRFKKDPERVSLNDLVKERRIVKSTTTPTAAIAPIKTKEEYGAVISAETKSTIAKETAILDCADDVNVLATADIVEPTPQAAMSAESSRKSHSPPPFRHLSDIIIDLDNVTPQSERLLLDDDDVLLTLSLTTNRPSKQVSVIVISLINKSKMALNEFQFEASVKKPSKVRLLPPSANSTPPTKPFRPPVPVNQVILLYNPTGAPVDLICIVGYKLGNDPDPIKESIVAKDIPFVE